MQYVVIGMADDKLEPRLAGDAREAITWDNKFREKAYERVVFTDGMKFFSRDEMEEKAKA